MTSSLLTVSIGISVVGNFCMLNLYEQYRLTCKEDILDSHLHPNILISLTALSLGLLISFGSMFSSVLAVEDLNSATGTSRGVEYNSIHIAFSALLPSICTGLGLYVCSRNRIFVKDEIDTINEFITETKTKNIKEIRAMKHKSEVLNSSLRSSPLSLCLGGFLIGCGICCSQYLLLASATNFEASFSPGLVFAALLMDVIYGVVACWVLFRLLSLYPFNENMRFLCLLALSFLSIAAHIVSISSRQYRGNAAAATGTGLTGQDIEHVFLPMMAVLVLIFLGIIATDMRIWYVKLNFIISETDDLLMKLKLDLSRKGQFVDEYYELRRIDGYALRHRSPDKSCQSNSSSPVLNRSPSPNGKRREPLDAPAVSPEAGTRRKPSPQKSPHRDSTSYAMSFPEKKVSFQCDTSSRKTDSTYIVSDKTFDLSIKSDLTMNTSRSADDWSSRDPISRRTIEDNNVSFTALENAVDLEANYGAGMSDRVEIEFDENPMNIVTNTPPASNHQVRAEGWLSGSLMSSLFHYGAQNN